MGKGLLYVKLQTGAERQPCLEVDLTRTLYVLFSDLLHRTVTKIWEKMTS